MNLSPGQRLTCGERTAYELVETAWTTPRHTWMRARKVFWNFRYPGEVLHEAGSDEWLDVLVRIPNPSGPGSVPDRPMFECESVFGRSEGPWFLELLDILDHPDAPQDEPFLVLVDPHATPVGARPRPTPEEAMTLVRMMTEALVMLDHLHRAGLVATVLDPEDFLIDPAGHWFFVGTDRIEAARESSAVSNDLASWAECVERLLGATDRGLAEVAWPFPSAMPEPARWLFERACWCLDPDPARRPATVSDLGRDRKAGPGAISSLRRLLGRYSTLSW